MFKLNPITGKLDMVMSHWTKSGDDIYYSTGKVGIGTDSPQRPLHMVGDGTAASGWARFGLSTTEYTEIGHRGGNSAINAVGDGRLDFRHDNSNKMSICSDGRVGIGETSPDALFHVKDGAILAEGTTGGTPVSGAGTRMIWIPAKAAFRAGEVDGTQWNDANIGDISVAFGYKGTASGAKSTHFGNNGVASGAQSAHFGYSGVASGNYSIHFGNSGTVNGNYSAHFGYGGTVSGEYAAHFGRSGIAAGNYSWVGGKYMQLSAAADKSFAFGHHSSAVALTQPNTFYIFPGGTAGKVAIGTTAPAVSAIVDITSTVGALILPRMTTVQRDALTAVNGMLLYDTTLNQTQTYENGAWRQI